MSSHAADFYVQVEPEFSPNGENVRAIRAVRLTQRRPQFPLGGTVLVKLSIRIPDAAFLPLRPEAIVNVPESLTEATPIVVEAGDPS